MASLRTVFHGAGVLGAGGKVAARLKSFFAVGVRTPHFLVAFAVAVETLAVSLAAYLGVRVYHILIGVPSAAVDQWKYYGAAFFLSLTILLLSLAFRHFVAFQTRTLGMVLANAFGTVALSFSLMLSALFLLGYTAGYSRGSFAFQFIAVCLVVLGGRSMLFLKLRSAVEAGLLKARQVLLVGESVRCEEVARQLKPCGVDVVHVTPPLCEGEAAARTVDQQLFIDSCRASKTRDILLILDPSDWFKTVKLVNLLSDLPASLHLVPTSGEDFLSSAQILSFGDVTTIQVARPPLTIADQVLKRVFDIFAATVGLILLAPLFLMVACAIKLDSPGPVFFRQQRRGYNKQPILVFKFRSMHVMENCSEHIRQAHRNDPRVTRVGRVLRQTNMDELPQLLNVLLGQMSIVGPRPHATAHDKLFEELIPPYSRRHKIKPGISGWAQVNGYRGETDTIEKMQRRVEYDLHYIENWSLWFDLKIVLLTLFSKKTYKNAY